MTDPGHRDEARLVDTESGIKPEGDGWFVVNMADAAVEGEGPQSHWRRFEGDDRFPHFGFNVHTLAPGEVSSVYHREEAQEAFLILHGECILLVEGEERRLKQWDFFNCAPWTNHTFVGAGDGPCSILMVGARNAGEGLVYPMDDVAAKHNANPPHETPDPKVAYEGWAEAQPMKADWPPT